MRLLLVTPVFGYRDYPKFLSVSDFPAGFAYLTSSLKQAGHGVYGCNPNNITGYASGKDMLQAVLTKRIKEIGPELIGIGGLCTDYACLKDSLEIIRSCTQAPVVMGGNIITYDAQFVFETLRPDWAIPGEGELPLVQLANDIEAGAVPSKGVLARKHADKLDSLPFPDYEPFGVEDMVNSYSMATRLLYRYSRTDPRPFIITASRSCPFTCSFCVHGRRDIPYRARSLENIMAELKSAYEKYHFNILIILDELFAVNKSRMKDFCLSVLDGRKNYGWDFDWMFQTHASARLDRESLSLAKEAGCFFFSYGLESASPTVLESMNKRIKLEQVIEAISLAKEAGIGFGANLIFGDPAETSETFSESIRFWLEYCKGAFVFMSNVTPYPGSRIFNYCMEKGIIKDKKSYYEHIDNGAINMTSMADRKLEELLALTGYMEQSWLFAAEATGVSCLPIDKTIGAMTPFAGRMYEIAGVCPYCKQRTAYHQPIPDVTRFHFLGTGCVHCQQRIRITVS